MSQAKQDILRTLPKMDHLITSDSAILLDKKFGQNSTRDSIRQELDATRNTILLGDKIAFDEGVFWKFVGRRLDSIHSMSLKRVINATGIYKVK